MGSAIEQRPPPRTSTPRPSPRLGDFRIVEVTLGEHGPGGRRVMDVPWPESSLVVAIRRGLEVIVPRGDTELLPHDRLTVLLPSAAASDLADLVSAAPSPTTTRRV
jgi:Trk K+ transport system NAD-binding subunit